MGWATLNRNNQNTHTCPSTPTRVFSSREGLSHTHPHPVSQLPDRFWIALPPSVRSNSPAATPPPVPLPQASCSCFPRSAAVMCTTVLLLWVLVSFKLTGEFLSAVSLTPFLPHKPPGFSWWFCIGTENHFLAEVTGHGFRGVSGATTVASLTEQTLEVWDGGAVQVTTRQDSASLVSGH